MDGGPSWRVRGQFHTQTAASGGTAVAVIDLFRMDGKRALVTGGSRGLGRAIAQAFAEAGASLVLVGRTPETLERARIELAALGGRVDIIVSDLHDAATATS